MHGICCYAHFLLIPKARTSRNNVKIRQQIIFNLYEKNMKLWKTVKKRSILIKNLGQFFCQEI